MLLKSFDFYIRVDCHANLIRSQDAIPKQASNLRNLDELEKAAKELSHKSIRSLPIGKDEEIQKQLDAFAAKSMVNFGFRMVNESLGTIHKSRSHFLLPHVRTFPISYNSYVTHIHRPTSSQRTRFMDDSLTGN